jgi:hypothetical protein
MTDYVETTPLEVIECGCTYRTLFINCESEVGEMMLRNIRDEKLKRSDIYMTPDYPITEEKREEWRTYRQQLRDLPSTITDFSGFRVYQLLECPSEYITSNIDREGFSWPTPPSP